MNSTIFVLGLIIGILIGYSLAKRRGGLSAARDAVARRKEEAKGRIMELFAGKEEIANDDVERLLGVSDATATNYLSELEEEGKIVQIGTVGRPVRYRRNG